MKKIMFIMQLQIFTIGIAQAVDLVITSPGVYEFGSDITSNPVVPNDTIVRVDVSNVVLNFRDHFLKQQVGNTQPGLKGIVISAGVKNVTIKNGTIRDLLGKGIVVSAGCSSIIIENLNIDGCTLRGMEFNGTSTSPIEEVLIKNSKIVRCCMGTLGDIGILCEHVFNSKIENVSLIGNGIESNNFEAIKFSNSGQNQLKNCEFVDNNGKLCIAAHMINAPGNVFRECRVISNNAGSESFHGFLAETNSHENIFEQCIAESNQGNGGASFEINGFTINGCNFCNLVECTSRLNSGTGNGSIVHGFKVNDAQAANLIKCVSSHNSHLVELGNVFGIFWQNNFMCSALDCLVESNNATNEGIGMQITDCTQCETRDSQFLFNGGDLLKRGLRISGGENNLFLSNVAFSNGTMAIEQIEGLGVLETSDLNTAARNLTTVTNPWINIRAFVGLPV
jgi:hypothetical protein